MTIIPIIERLPTVLARLGIGKSTLYTMINKGLFNPPLRLGARAVGWLQSDVSEFIETRANARSQGVTV